MPESNMAWNAYRVLFRVLSPIHIGFERIGNLQRTRPYVPGRNLWAAVAARMVLTGISVSYTEARAEIDKHLCFGYLFPTLVDRTIFMPFYENGTVLFGPSATLSKQEFEYRFLGSTAHTALRLENRGAEEGSLHEVECILPRARPDGEPVYLTGALFVRRQSDNSNLEALMGDLQVGGERTYGMGRIQLSEMQPVSTDIFAGFTLELNAESLVAKGRGPVPAHWVLDRDAPACSTANGDIEMLVGRDTSDSGYGVNLAPARLCWAPGSVPDTSRAFRISPQGFWTEL